MSRSRFKISMFIAVLIIAFSAGHTMGSECPYHQPSCGYAVSGCIQLTYSCQSSGYCWREYGKCCEDPGTDFSVFCGPGCDGSGGGGCGLEM
jgi:hypothetical protein